MEKGRPKISTCILAYNHEKFIRKCLDGAVSQKLNYDHEIVIGEDKSLDNTLEICMEYKQKYPHLVKLMERNKNLGMMRNWMQTLQECNGEYIAICEGDDYWADDQKLQKQVDFLEKNPEYVICGTRTRRINEKGKFGENTGKKYGRITLEDVLWKNEFGTCTVVFRRKYLELPPFSNYSSFFGIDWQMWCSLLKKGPGYNLEDLTAVYHEHSAGASSGRNRQKILKNKLEDRLLMIENFPNKKKIIKNYGLKIVYHYFYKALLFKKPYIQALLSNKKLVNRYLFL